MKPIKISQIIRIIALVATPCLWPSVGTAICQPGAPSYHLAHRRALLAHLQDPATGLTTATSGRLRISSNLYEGTEINPNGFKSRIKIRESYSSLANEFGLLFRETIYELESDKNCLDFIVTKIQKQNPLNIGTPIAGLTNAVRASYLAFSSAPDAVPTNRHSGDFSAAVHQPTICPDGFSISTNLVRSNHQSTGLSYRTWSYLVEAATGKILKEDVRPGRWLRNMCP